MAFFPGCKPKTKTEAPTTLPQPAFEDLRTPDLTLMLPTPLSTPAVLQTSQKKSSKWYASYKTLTSGVDKSLTLQIGSEMPTPVPSAKECCDDFLKMKNISYEKPMTATSGKDPIVGLIKQLPSPGRPERVIMTASEIYVQNIPLTADITEHNIVRTPQLQVETDRALKPSEEFEAQVFADEAPPTDQRVIVVPPGEEPDAPIPVEIYLIASKGISVLNQGVQTIFIKPAEPRSNIVKFRLRVAADVDTDAAVLSAYFNYKGRSNGKVERVVKLEPSASRPVVTACGQVVIQNQELSFDPKATEPALTVEIRDPCRDTRNLVVVVRTPLIEKYRKGIMELWPLRTTTAALVADRTHQFSRGPGAEQRLASLQGAGVKLYGDTPKIFQKVLWELINSSLFPAGSTIYINSEEPNFPWELIIPQTPDGKSGRKFSLGQEFTIGRWITPDGNSPPQSIAINSSTVIAPTYGSDDSESQQSMSPPTLPTAEDEADTVCKMFHTQPLKPAKWTDVDGSLGQLKTDLIHFACHGSSDQSSAEQVVYLDEGDELTSDQVLQLPHFDCSPLVFLNACETARREVDITAPSGFVSSFIQKGASAVIAPLWSVKDTNAHDVAVQFYKEMKKSPQKSLAKIVSEIRAKAYDGVTKGEDTYAAYCFFGDPSAKWHESSKPDSLWLTLGPEAPYHSD